MAVRRFPTGYNIGFLDRLVILYNILIEITDNMFSKFTSNMSLKKSFYI
jgi:hypothetical protein